MMIATPAYGCVVNANYVHNLLAYQKAQLPFTLLTIGNESLITRARNSALAWFYANEALTHLLFIDADVGLSPESLAGLIGHDVDVIGAAVPLKFRGEGGKRLFNFGRVIGNQGSLWKVEKIGTAVLMLSRAAVQALVDDAIVNDRVYQRPDEEVLHYDVFQVGVINGDYQSEDFWICERLRKLGFDIYLDPELPTQHYGTISI